MKKNFIALGLIVAATFTLTNCAKEIDNPSQQPESAGIPFEITASTPDTKTANDGLNTVWSADDAINLFHAEAGSTAYVDDGKFSVAAADVDAGRFTGTLGGDLAAGKSYDWYALYPYSEYITTPGEKDSGFTFIGYSSGLNQSGYNSTASLKGSVCPLYGVAEDVAAGQTPSVTMNHLSSVIAINVTNKNDEPLTITTASFTATEDIVGSYFIDMTKTPVVYTPNTAQNTATVEVTGGTALAKGESAVLYLAIKPFTAAKDAKLYLSVNGYQKELVLTKDVTFTAGKIKTLNFGYDKVISGKSVTFDFTKASELEALGITLPEKGNGTNISSLNLTKGEITLTSTDGSTSSRVWNSSGSYDLRLYKNATLTITADGGYVIKSVTITGGAVGDISKSTIPSNPVVLTVASDAGTQKVSTITIEYEEGEVEILPLVMGELSCVNATSSTLTFTWDDVAGAEGYKVSVDGGVTYGELIIDPNYTWENLEAEQEYTICPSSNLCAQFAPSDLEVFQR